MKQKPKEKKKKAGRTLRKNKVYTNINNWGNINENTVKNYRYSFSQPFDVNKYIWSDTPG